MKASQPVAKTVMPWLKTNLGPRCLGCLTGQDTKALLAAAQIIELWTYTDSPNLAIVAFAAVVRSMSSGSRELAYHAIAHVANWGDREVIWRLAGLDTISSPRICAFEPAGRGF